MWLTPPWGWGALFSDPHTWILLKYRFFFKVVFLWRGSFWAQKNIKKKKICPMTPRNPGGPNLENQGPWKIGLPKKIFFCWNCKLWRLSFHLRPWSSKLDPPDPFWTQKTKKNTPKVHGSLQGNPPSGSPVDQTGSPTSIILVILQTRGFKGYPQKKLSYPTLSPSASKVQSQ